METQIIKYEEELFIRYSWGWKAFGECRIAAFFAMERENWSEEKTKLAFVAFIDLDT